jgi:dihydropteroate synthase
MAILNVTPDSFSDGGRFLDPQAALVQAKALADAGAGMLDLGAESTRPGAEALEPGLEWERLEPVLAALRKELPGLPLSVDTRHAPVAEQALGLGASVINDVGGCSDPAMLRLVSASACGLIAMRSRTRDGRLWMPAYDAPGTTSAEQSITELRALRTRLSGAGIAPGRMLLDPGFGFGTTYLEDLALWAALPSLPARLDWPLERFCLGVSRKRFVARRFAGDSSLAPGQRDPSTAAAHAQALAWGYRVFRTHAVSGPNEAGASRLEASGQSPLG